MTTTPILVHRRTRNLLHVHRLEWHSIRILLRRVDSLTLQQEDLEEEEEFHRILVPSQVNPLDRRANPLQDRLLPGEKRQVTMQLLPQ